MKQERHNSKSNQHSSPLRDKLPGFEREWKKIVKKMGDDFVQLMDKRLKGEYRGLDGIMNFRLTVVVDNNFLFGQIKGVLKSNSAIEDTLIYRLGKSKSVLVYAPPKLKQEIYAKISLLLSDQEEAAKGLADQLLEFITIQDAQWIDEWKKANSLIGHVDSDDVPYLALAFHVGSHAIVSSDSVFQKQGDAQVWNKTETERILTTYQSGALSFCLFGSTPFILHEVANLFVAFFKILRDILRSFLKAAGVVVAGAIGLVAEIPAGALLTLFLAGAAAIFFSEDLRKELAQAGNEFMIKLPERMNGALQKLGDFIQTLSDFFSSLCEALIPLGMTSLEILGFLTAEYELMIVEIERLESERAK